MFDRTQYLVEVVDQNKFVHEEYIVLGRSQLKKVLADLEIMEINQIIREARGFRNPRPVLHVRVTEKNNYDTP